MVERIESLKLPLFKIKAGKSCFNFLYPFSIAPSDRRNIQYTIFNTQYSGIPGRGMSIEY
jgi:hypothetical protein